MVQRDYLRDLWNYYLVLMDAGDMIQGVDKLLFRDFIRSAASRTGEILNIHAIAGDVGINDDTVKRWLQVLEKSEIITLLRP